MRQDLTKWTRLWLKRKVTLLKILQWVAGSSDTITAKDQTHDNSTCLSRIKSDNNTTHTSRTWKLATLQLCDVSLTLLLPGSPLIGPQVRSPDFFSLSSCVLSSCYPFAHQHKCADPSGSTQWSLSPQGGLIAPNWCEALQFHESRKPCHLRILHPTVRNLTRSQCFLQPPRRPFQISVLRETRIFDFHGHVGGNDIFHAMCQIVELSCESRYIIFIATEAYVIQR